VARWGRRYESECLQLEGYGLAGDEKEMMATGNRSVLTEEVFEAGE
jgi:hypothetical protein